VDRHCCWYRHSVGAVASECLNQIRSWLEGREFAHPRYASTCLKTLIYQVNNPKCGHNVPEKSPRPDRNPTQVRPLKFLSAPVSVTLGANNEPRPPTCPAQSHIAASQHHAGDCTARSTSRESADTVTRSSEVSPRLS